jgi:kynurenine formamidase
VRQGITISLGWPLNTVPAPDNRRPAEHRMTDLGGEGALKFAKDYIGVDYHNDTHTHIDALCHVGYDGTLYNGRPAGTVTSAGAEVESIETLKDGLVGRGVLLDIPRLRGAPWLEPGESVFREDLETAQREQGVTVKEGDILLVRTGHARRLDELGPWDTAAAKAGLHPGALSFLAERGVAALCSDTNSDTAPSSTDGIDFPVQSSQSPQWACTCSTTCGWRSSLLPASGWGAGSSCSSQHRFALPAAPARPPIPSRSSNRRPAP